MIAGAVLFNAAGTSAVRQLATIDGLQWLDDIDAEGSFSFRIPVEDADNIEIGSTIKIYYGATSADFVFSGTVENIKLERTGQTSNGVARTYEINGRGIRARLEDAIVYPDGGSTTRSFTNQTAGDIFLTLYSEAQLRGALLNFSVDFTAGGDSNGDPYNTTITADEKVGTTLLEIANKHQELAVDVWVTPDQVIHYANDRGTDRTVGTNPTVLRVGQSISDMTAEAAGPIRNTVLVGSGQDGATFNTRADIGSQIAYGRRETFLALANTSDSTQVELAADNLLENTANPSDGITIELSDTGPVPYIDYDLGDWLWVADETGARTKYRLRAITASQDPDGTIKFVPELGTVRADLDRRLNRALKRIERGVPDGTVLAAATPSDYDFGAGGIGALTPGTVVTYTSATTSGTVDIDGTTGPFSNASSVRLEPGDEILLVSADGYPDPIAVALYDRTGGPTGYDTYEFVVPTSVPGLPRTVPYIMGQVASFNPESSYAVQQDSSTTQVFVGGTASNNIEIENWDTATTSALPSPSGLSFANVQVLATPTVRAWADSSVRLHVHYAGTTTTYNYGGVQLAGVNGTTIVATAHTNLSGVNGAFIIEISSTGVVTDTDVTTVAGTWYRTPFAYRFSRAGGGHIIVKASASFSSALYVDGVMYTAPTGTLALPEEQLSSSSSGLVQHLRHADIIDDYLYWMIGNANGQPYNMPVSTRLGFCRMNLNTPGTFDYFPDIMTVTGDPQDGEPMRLRSLAALADGRVIIGHSLWTGYVNPTATNATNAQKNELAAYSISNGVTTQTFIPSYALLDPETQLFGSTVSEKSTADVSTDVIGSQYTVVYRRDNRNSTIIDGGAI